MRLSAPTSSRPQRARLDRERSRRRLYSRDRFRRGGGDGASEGLASHGRRLLHRRQSSFCGGQETLATRLVRREASLPKGVRLPRDLLRLHGSLPDGRLVIPKIDCKDRALYRIRSRNLLFGVYREETGGFLGLREKFGSIYVFEEYHWENGPPYGTVHPLEALSDALPEEIPLAEYLPGSSCTVCGADSRYALWPEGGERDIGLSDGAAMQVPGQWEHVDGTRCEKMYGYGRANRALHEWLAEREKREAGNGT